MCQFTLSLCHSWYLWQNTAHKIIRLVFCCIFKNWPNSLCSVFLAYVVTGYLWCTTFKSKQAKITKSLPAYQGWMETFTQVKMKAEGWQFVMNLSTSFASPLFPPLHCLSSNPRHQGRFNDTDGNSRLCFSPTLVPSSISSINLCSESLSLQNPSSCHLSKLPSEVRQHETPQGNNNDLESKCGGTRCI